MPENPYGKPTIKKESDDGEYTLEKHEVLGQVYLNTAFMQEEQFVRVTITNDISVDLVCSLDED